MAANAASSSLTHGSLDTVIPLLVDADLFVPAVG
jgi:hypothetical protein